MNQYAYRIYKDSLNNPVVVGTIHADNMEQAAQKIIERNRIQVIHDIEGYSPDHYLMRDGYKVGILIYLNPEYL